MKREIKGAVFELNLIANSLNSPSCYSSKEIKQMFKRMEEIVNKYKFKKSDLKNILGVNHGIKF